MSSLEGSKLTAITNEYIVNNIAGYVTKTGLLLVPKSFMISPQQRRPMCLLAFCICRSPTPVTPSRYGGSL